MNVSQCFLMTRRMCQTVLIAVLMMAFFSDEDSSNEDIDGDEAEDSKGSDADEDDE